MLILAQLPAGATYERTLAVLDKVEDHLREDEAETVRAYFTIAGFSFAGSGQNMGVGFVPLKNWDERKGKDGDGD